MKSPAADIGLDAALDWDAWLKDIAASPNHIDPYTLWSIQTAFRQHLRRGSAKLEVMDFLVELDQPYADVAGTWPAGLQVPEIYARPMPGSNRTARHVTVRLRMPSSLSQLAGAIWKLVLRKEVRRAQIGFPRAAFAGEHAVPALLAATRQHDEGGPAAGPTPKVLLGVFEDACPFGHSALRSRRETYETRETRETRESRETRVVALWDQSLSAAGIDSPPAEMGYGRVRNQAELQALLEKHSDARGVDEEALYRDPAALQPRLRSHGSHAAAVIGLLAGRAAGLPSHPTSSDDPADAEHRPHRRQDVADDAAAQAPLAVVQFPREQIDIAGARWMVVRALDGLRFLAQASARLAPKDRAPVPLVVNLSYGGVVGAHDGTGILETAMAELAAAHGCLAVVLAAGNSHGTQRVGDASDVGERWPSGRQAECADPMRGRSTADASDVGQRWPSGRHAECAALMPGNSTTLALYVPPNKPIETCLEIWFEGAPQNGAGSFLDADEITVEVTSPSGRRLCVDRLPGVDFDHPWPRHTCAGLIGLQRVAQSHRSSMVLLMVAATQISSTRVEVPSGAWSVSIHNRGHRALRVQAWVERDMLPGSGRSTQAARLLGRKCGDAQGAELTDANTFSNIATGEQVFRVGALTWLSETGRPAVSPYSSQADRGRPGPEFSAVADMSAALPGIRVSGNTSASVGRMNGTSVAAPQAARWIANQLAAGRTLAQIRGPVERDSKGDGRRGKRCI